MSAQRPPVHTGLDVFLHQDLPALAGRRVGLITNPTGIDRQFRSGVDLLRQSAEIELVALFGPEHGVRGDVQAGVRVQTAVDGRTGLPIHSLYGETQRPSPSMLAGLDALIFDIQDIGVRYATYISTMAYAQAAAADAGLMFVVFDRPNPLGSPIDGNLLDPAFASFVGVHPLPVLHGLTTGELARLLAAERGWPAPFVVAIQRWQHGLWFEQTGLPWVQPSPNLPTLDAVTLYGGTCLIEGTNLSEGRGTTRPFELVGAPWIDPFRAAEELQRREIPGVAFRPAYFTPTFSKHAGVACGGVQIHILHRSALRPVELGVELLYTLRRLGPGEFAWRQGGDGRFFVDLLLGSDQPRRALDDGSDVADVIAGWDEQRRAFESRRRPYLLYETVGNEEHGDTH
ncbi:MAG TPA: DUF1343 domain-containing protein [Herpetosiphonaceae bacterium]|nr:DUF1343 domain-containing protein [Herpetosiphonaceae bacterium]